jgi:rhodanese-related sulfurtransferase
MGENVKPEDARVGVASNEYVVIDVRDSEDWNDSAERIPGSVHVPPDEIEAKLEELPEDKDVLLVSPDDERSAEIAEKIEGDGREVKILEGGVEAWKSEGLLTQPSPDAAPPKPEDAEPHESAEDEEGDEGEDAGGTAQAEEDAEGEPADDEQEGQSR